jgi:hypothetical protein
MATKTIEMVRNRRVAGARRAVGDVVDGVDAAVADHFIALGDAKEVKGKRPQKKAPETATAPAGETATKPAPRRRTRTKKGA